MDDHKPLHILAASGSSRPANYTRRVLALAVDELQTRYQVQVDLIDLSTADFPFPGQGPSRATHQAQELVKGAAGILLATPEYHGSYSSAMKRFIENLGFPSTLAGKPVALLPQRVLGSEERSGHYGRASMDALRGKGQARARPAPCVG